MSHLSDWFVFVFGIYFISKLDVLPINGCEIAKAYFRCFTIFVSIIIHVFIDLANVVGTSNTKYTNPLKIRVKSAACFDIIIKYSSSLTPKVIKSASQSIDIDIHNTYILNEC